MIAVAYRRLARLVLLAVLVAAAAGCATVPADAGRDPADPWEGFNRQVFAMNDAIDHNVVKPLAEGYVLFVPGPVRQCVSNILANLRDVPGAANNLLQGRPLEALSDFCRVVVNTTIGVFGCFDVATEWGLKKNYQDFGLTLGRWGFESGPYLMLPLLGPSTVRDAIGRLPDGWLNPSIQLRWIADRPGLFVVDVLDTRSRLLPLESAFGDVSLDRYQFIRDAYLQRRRSLLYDGDPPSDKLPVYEDPDEPAPVKPAPAPAPATGAPAQEGIPALPAADLM